MKPSTHADSVATEHFLTLTDPGASAEEIQRVLNWMDESSANKNALEMVERFWRACDDLEHGERILSTRANPTCMGRGTRWTMVSAAMAATLAGVFCVRLLTASHEQIATPIATADHDLLFQSPTGEIRQIALADGSTITLSAASAVSVAYHSSERHISLDKGEALFQVAKDSARPFVVDTGSGTVTAVGTEFDVERAGDKTLVMVAHGRVRVGARNSSGDIRSVNLDAGMEVSYAVDGSLGKQARVDQRAIGNWRYGELNFVDRPLKWVVADLNRYTLRPIIIDDPALAEISVTGVVHVNAMEEWLRGLSSVIHIDMSTTDLSVIHLKRRRSHI
jgi:transmembrane sensor